MFFSTECLRPHLAFISQLEVTCLPHSKEVNAALQGGNRYGTNTLRHKDLYFISVVKYLTIISADG